MIIRIVDYRTDDIIYGYRNKDRKKYCIASLSTVQ